MEMSILQKIRNDPEVRGAFVTVLTALMEISKPKPNEGTIDVDKFDEPLFDAHLAALIDIHRSLDLRENETKIGHWCIRETEGKVRGMDTWSAYWLDLRVPSPEVVDDEEGHLLQLTLWAVGKDDNTVQKGIKVWVENHMPRWEIENLKCVRR